MSATTSIHDVERTACVKLKAIEASVSAYRIQERPGVLDGGEWFALSIRRTRGDTWEVLGRRRTLAELFKLIESTNGRQE
jgi:hypothetical protein